MKITWEIDQSSPLILEEKARDPHELSCPEQRASNKND